MAYVGAWKKCDPLWGMLIHLRRLNLAIPSLERILRAGDRTPDSAEPVNGDIANAAGAMERGRNG